MSTEYILKVLGLDICSDTIVGNDMLRGVSGGQRKRVTTGFPLFLVLYFSLSTREHCSHSREISTKFSIA